MFSMHEIQLVSFIIQRWCIYIRFVLGCHCVNGLFYSSFSKFIGFFSIPFISHTISLSFQCIKKPIRRSNFCVHRIDGLCYSCPPIQFTFLYRKFQKIDISASQANLWAHHSARCFSSSSFCDHQNYLMCSRFFLLTNELQWKEIEMKCIAMKFATIKYIKTGHNAKNKQLKRERERERQSEKAYK